ncbi:MAG: TRAP transporter substrate-binding protein DctP [Dehalococcoidales bacterium]|nr:TRAP transporter substrate-binding protein DctP [Dehalococcoidales bacterium]
MINKKHFLYTALLMIVAVVMLMSACTSATTQTSVTTSTQTTTQTQTTTKTTTTTQPIIQLTFGSTNPSTHTYSIADMAWIAKMEADSNGIVQITPYWDGTLLSKKESTDELAKGVADIGFCQPGYSTKPFPIHLGTLGFYYGIPDYEARRAIYDQLTKDFPEVEAEFENIKVLCTSVGATYQLITNKPIRTIDDFKGMRIKGTGVFLEVLQALGAEGVSLPMTEVYTQLDKGLIDGALAPYETFVSLHFGEVAKYCTVLDMTSAVFPTRGMNMNVWNGLPANIKQIFENNIAYWGEQEDKLNIEAAQKGYDQGLADGVQYIELSAADLAKYNQIVESIMLVKAGNLDAAGFAGTAMYEEVRQLAEQYSK